jgi:mRNA interferase RelE/StbE
VPEVELSRRAVKDLDSLPKRSVKRIVDALVELGGDPESTSRDVKALVGKRPWRRLRIGNYRVLFRTEGDVVLVARVIDRKELDRAVRSLPD